VTSLNLKGITKEECRDTGMAMVLLFLILFVSLKRNGLLLAAIGLQVLNMTWSGAYRPIAVVWLGLSRLVGAVVSKVLLSVVFFGVVTPIAIVRRLTGSDSLQLKAFKASDKSVMVDRHHVFIGRDIERPD